MLNLTLSQIFEGYLLEAKARRLSPSTIRTYTDAYNKLQTSLAADLPFNEITSNHIRTCLVEQHVSKKSLYNYHVALSAIWTWAIREELTTDHILKRVQRPKPEEPDIVPYSRKDVLAMLSVINKHARKVNGFQIAERHRAVLFLLLDTGLRASELCNIKISDIDRTNSHITVWGKGDKQRTVPFSANTGKILWRWLTQRPDDTINDYLFITFEGRKMSRRRLLRTFQSIGRHAGVPRVTLHRFRHTFAIQFLRNGGDIFSLQHILGHRSLSMVKRYLAIAQVDIENAHRRASPTANWGL